MEWLLFIIYAFSMSIVSLFCLAQLNLTWHYVRKENPPLLDYESSYLPHITLQLPLYNEKYVINRLLDAVTSLDYPQTHLEIQILDDSNDETVTMIDARLNSIKSKGINIVHLRRKDKIGYKAGALQYGLMLAQGELIAIFDADFIPQKDFLKKVIPYFKNDQTAMVQTRWSHLNENFNLLTQIQAFGLNAHFTIEQSGRRKANSFINFNGTAGIWRKKSILDAGGWQHDTLTEDLDLSYRAQLNGWEFEYLESVESPAELPVTLQAVKTQQFRWNKGTAETIKKNIGKVIRSDLKLNHKLRAIFHLLNSTVFLFIFIAALLSIPLIFIKNEYPQVKPIFDLGLIFLVGFIAIGIFYWFAIKAHHKRPLTYFCLYFPLYLTFSVSLSLHNSLALLEGFLNIKTGFVRTPKFGVRKNTDDWKSNSYIKQKISFLNFIEGLCMLYFAWGLNLSFTFKDYGFLPFHTMLTIGFGYLFFNSIINSFKNVT